MRRANIVKRARLTKSQSKPSIDSWTDLFGSKNLMAIMAPYMHLYDIIHLAMTCKRLIGFYYGTKLTKVLCTIVKRDCNVTYVNSPLQYLGRAYNVREIDDGFYVANRCCRCSASTDEKHSHRKEASKYMCCKPCIRFFTDRQFVVMYDESINLLTDIFTPEHFPRVMRLLRRSILCNFSEQQYKLWYNQDKTRCHHINDYFNEIFLQLSVCDIGIRDTDRYPSMIQADQNKRKCMGLHCYRLVRNLFFMIDMQQFMKQPEIRKATPAELMFAAKQTIDSIEW